VPSVEDLVNVGLSFEEAREKVRLNYRILANKLIEKGIPSQMSSLFAYRVDWGSGLKCKPVLGEDLVRRKFDEIMLVNKTSERTSNNPSSEANDGVFDKNKLDFFSGSVPNQNNNDYLDDVKKGLFERIKQRVDPRSIVSWLANLGILPNEECERLICILWRHVIFESESKAIGLVNVS
jgi:hypothetical protein